MTAFLVCVTQHNPDPYFGKPYIYVIELLITLIEMHTLTSSLFLFRYLLQAPDFGIENYSSH